MLRARIYINEDEIEDIQIVNIKEKQKDSTHYKVNVIKRDEEFEIWHDRVDGWETLLRKVLVRIER